MASTVTDSKLLGLMIAEATKIITEATKRQLHLRLLGAIAFQVHCPKFSFLSRKLNRILTDIDFAGYSKERAKVANMMREFGYQDEASVTAMFGHRRMIWDHKSNGLHVDVFLDRLEMNHDIPFENRLDLVQLTIPLADMLLEKMQIVRITEKDYIDAMMLLREHSIDNDGDDPEAIDASYIAKLLSKDWGFYYTVTSNLTNVNNRLSQYNDISEDDREDITRKTRALVKRIEDEPKPLSWKMRSRVGPKSQWYRVVEEVSR
jgi:hypothetical protein